MTITTIWGMWAGYAVGAVIYGLISKNWDTASANAFFSATFAALLTLRIWLTR